MKYIRRQWKILLKEVDRIHLVDKCLIVFMGVLLAQSAYSLFAHTPGMSQQNEIDVIVRTSAASIFGYFLSVNFIGRESRKSQDYGDSDLTGASLEDEAEPENSDGEYDAHGGSGRLQILIAAGIGLFCLLTLILLRDFVKIDVAGSSPAATATITQFRDFVSGCVGFLIGCPTSGRGGK